MAKNALEQYKQLVQKQGQALLDVIQSVALGDLDVEIEIPEGIEAISDLAVGIEMMVDDIREMMAEQEQARAEIERARQQTEAALQETLALQRRYLGQEWQGLVAADQAQQGYFRSEDQEGPTDEAWLPAMTTAVQAVEAVTSEDEKDTTLALPIQLHDQVIGALGFDRPQDQPWRPEEIQAVQEIIEQVGWALENQRLFDDAQLASLLMGQRVNELDCLNAIGRKIDESPPIAEFLEWVAWRIPSAMRYPDVCQVAIEFEDQVYGMAQAIQLTRQIVAGLHIGGERVGQVTIAYTEARDFINEESALLGDIIRRVSGYIEKQRLLEQTQAALEQASIFRQFAQTSAQGIGFATLEGEITYANPTLVRLFGKAEPADVIGTTIDHYYTQEIWQRLNEHILPTVMQQGQWVGELDLVSPTGEAVPTIQNLFILRDEEGNPRYLGNLVTDITTLKQAEFLLAARVKELDCLNAIGRKIDESPRIAEFLEWVAGRIPSAMRYPDLCRVAIEFEGQVYGQAEASKLSRQIVAGLHVSGERLGRALIAYTEDRDFINEESALLGDIVRRVSGYIENRRLFRQAQTRAQEQTVLTEMGRALSARLDVESVVENVYRHASRLVDTTNFYIALYDVERNEISFPYYTQEGETIQVGGRAFGEGLTEYVIQTRQPLLIREDVSAQLEELGIEMIGREAFSWLGVPMTVGEQVIGVIAIQSHSVPNLYGKHDQDLLSAIASQAAIAIMNANLFEQTQAALSETEEQARRLALLNQTSAQLNSATNLDEILRITATQVNHIIPADRVSLISLLDDGESYQVLALHGEKGPSPAGPRSPLKGSNVERAVRENRIINVSQPERDDLGNIRSFMVAPLHTGGQVTGTLNVGSKQAHVYGSRDEDLIRQIALILSATMENRKLFEQTQDQLEDLTAIQKTTAELTATLTFDEAVEALLPQVANAVQADTVSMFLIEEAHITRVGSYATGEVASPQRGQTLPLADYPLIQQTVETRQPIALTPNDPRLQEHARQSFKASGVSANTTIPLVGREGVMGILAVSLHQPGRTFNENDIRIMQTLADQATIAFERIRLLEDTTRRARREQALREITARVRGSTNPDIIVRAAVRELGTALGRPTFVRLGSAEQLVQAAEGDGGKTGPLRTSTLKETGSREGTGPLAGTSPLEEGGESHA
jgi:PAS domain S-box-containing protein